MSVQSECQVAESCGVTIPAGRVDLEADLTLGPDSRGLILFAHGSGSSRHSPRNRRVARTLVDLGFATLLMDLLSAEEETVDLRTAEFRFDIPLLAERLCYATDWAGDNPDTCDFGIGYFGASTGAAAALVAAARQPDVVQAVVSRGGRPDLAGLAVLRDVRAPVLLIVGSRDSDVLELNQEAAGWLRASHEIRVVEGAGHLFEEPGALDRVASLAGDWFARYLGSPCARPDGRALTAVGPKS